jgi:hypothetical protein
MMLLSSISNAESARMENAVGVFTVALSGRMIGKSVIVAVQPGMMASPVAHSVMGRGGGSFGSFDFELADADKSWPHTTPETPDRFRQSEWHEN